MSDKLILDPCCGSRMMWFDKSNQNVVFGDIRNEEHTLCDGRLLSINPDYVFDARCLPFPDETFVHVVLDLPHIKKMGTNAWMAKKYGLLAATWESDIKGIFDESMRVLKMHGTLNFKWNESQIPETKVREILQYPPPVRQPARKGRQNHLVNFCEGIVA